MYGIQSIEIVIGNRMAGLVIGREFLLFVGNLLGFLLRTYDNLYGGLFYLLLCKGFLAAACGKESRLIQEVLKVCAREAGCRARYLVEFDIGTYGLVARVNPEYGFTADNIGIVDCYLSIETARTKERRVKDVRSVCRGHNDYARVLSETVHLDEQLVKCLLALVVTAAHAGASLATDGVNLVYENY